MRVLVMMCMVELPPRTRRIHQEWACYLDVFVNYLRVRGEYSLVQSLKLFLLELPPRTRRIPVALFWGEATAGTTSAYAENTLNELGLL